MAFQSRHARLLLRSVSTSKSTQLCCRGTQSFSNRVPQPDNPKSLHASFFTTRPPIRRTLSIVDLQKRYYDSRRPTPAPKRAPPPIQDESPKQYDPSQRYTPHEQQTPPKQHVPPRENHNPEPPISNEVDHQRRNQANKREFFGDLLVKFLIGVSVTVFAIKTHRLPPPKSIGSNIDKFLDENFVISRANLDKGRWWTYITHTFNHGSVLHLGFNMYALWSIGQMTSFAFGARGVALFYIVGGIVGGYAGVKLQKGTGPLARERGAVGASGSILSLLTGMAVLYPKLGIGFIFIPFSIPAWFFTIAFAGYSVFAEQNGLEEGTGHLGHLGGMAAGLVLGFIFKFRRPLGL